MLTDLVHEYLKRDGLTAYDRSALNRLQEYVEEFGRDFTKLSCDDIAAIFDRINSSTEDIIRKYKRCLEKFFDWTELQGTSMDGSQEGLKSFSLISKTKSIAFHKEWYYSSYQSMMDCFEVFVKNTGLTNPTKYAAYLTLAWFGVPRSVALNFKEADIVQEPGLFVIKDVVTIRNPVAIKAMRDYLYSDGYYTASEKFLTKKPSELYFRNPTYIPRSLANANKLRSQDHYFSYEEVADSATYSKTYDGLRALEIPITLHTHRAHARIVSGLLGLSDYFNDPKQTLFPPYLPFYEWCKTFRTVDDMASSD